MFVFGVYGGGCLVVLVAFGQSFVMRMKSVWYVHSSTLKGQGN